jgi:AraC-like DNA-binding protein
MKYSSIATTSQMQWRLIKSYGIDPAPLFTEAGLDPAKWNEPGARFDEAKLDHLWVIASELTGDPCIGLRAGAFVSPASLHALGFAWLASDTLADGLTRLVRYFRLLSEAIELELTVSGDECRLAVSRVLFRARCHEQAQDALWSAVLNLCRISTSDDFAPTALFLERDAPPCAGDFFALFRAPIEFGAPRDMMVFRREQVEAPLPTANRVLAHANDRVVAEYLALLDDRRFADQIRLRLVEMLPNGTVDAGHLARAMNLSLRTLQRRLADEGTSFTALLDEARQELALRWIGEEAMSVKEATYLLGFSEPANFTRAFRRWTGVSPTAFRRTGTQ